MNIYDILGLVEAYAEAKVWEAGYEPARASAVEHSAVALRAILGALEELAAAEAPKTSEALRIFYNLPAGSLGWEREATETEWVPSVGESVFIDGKTYEVKSLHWYPFGDPEDEVGPTVYVILDAGPTVREAMMGR